MRLVFALLSVFPLWLLHAIGWALGWATFLGSATYRRRFLENARQAGIPASGWRPAVAGAGKLVAELPRLWLGSPVQVQWSGQEHVDRALADGNGLIVLTPHIGSFEVAAQAYAAHYGVQGHPLTVLFRPPRQRWLRELVVASRVRPGLAAAPTTLGGVKQLVKALKSGHCVALLPDQVPPAGQGVWAPFFGREAYTMTLSAKLAVQTGATVLVAVGRRLSWGRGYIVQVRPLSEKLPADVTQATVQINQTMEAMVLQLPQQYLWGYARYKQPRSGE
jgi:KDO2-lipid IV(A) lauroyltransferase